MTELQTSNENALALYSLLSEGQRNSIRINGTLLSEIRKTLLSVFKSWEEVNEFVNKLNEKVRKYISICDDPKRTVRLSWAGAKEGDVWLEKYDNGTVMFRHKNTPANFWSSKAWNEVTVIDFMDNQKQAAKLKKKINEYCNL